VVIAGGVVGYGEAVPRGLALGEVGAVVVGPVMALSRAGAPPPRWAETIGGMVREDGWQSRGVSNVLSRYAKLWPKLGCPVVVQIAEAEPKRLASVVSRVAAAAGVLGIELVPLTEEVTTAAQLTRVAAQEGDLPVWVKLPLGQAAAWAEPLARAGANGLVIGQPPRGALPYHAALGALNAVAGDGLVHGALYGPAVFAGMVPVLAAVAGLGLPVALIACGGIHTATQMVDALAVGASAVQVDSGVWVEPGLPQWLAAAWSAQAGRS
jgi:dihydroorotate dehydrogenase